MAKSNAKKRLSSFGSSLLDGLSLAADLSIIHEMDRIEREIDRLQEEYAQKNASLSFDRKRTLPYVK
jgi:hypothetical protein